MIAIGLLFARMLCDCFRPRQQLEAEILVLQHQLHVLRRRATSTPFVLGRSCPIHLALSSLPSHP
jgi:hypothetical protein